MVPASPYALPALAAGQPLRHLRPAICRSYTTDKCEYEADWVYDHYWETAEQVVEYAEAVLGPRRGGSFRSPKPAA